MDVEWLWPDMNKYNITIYGMGWGKLSTEGKYNVSHITYKTKLLRANNKWNVSHDLHWWNIKHFSLSIKIFLLVPDHIISYGIKTDRAYIVSTQDFRSHNWKLTIELQILTGLNMTLK